MDDAEILEGNEKFIDTLYTLFNSYSYASEEFWETYDTLKKLLIDSIQIARRLGEDEKADRFREIEDDINGRIPSGYWK